MLVLKIIGGLVFAFLFYLLITWINAITFKKYNYEFITPSLAFLYASIYALLYFGRDFYLDALLRDGDILNGILLFSFGVITLLTRLILNMKLVGFFKGLFFTIVQVILYIPITVLAVVIIFFLLLAAAGTKPVYNTN